MTNKQTIRSVLSMLHIVRPKKIAIVQSLDAWMGIPAGPISEWNADGANYKNGQQSPFSKTFIGLMKQRSTCSAFLVAALPAWPHCWY